MKYIITIVRKMLSKELPNPTGRWRIEHCNKRMNSKVDLSNEDHCGPCGQYALTKVNTQTKESESKNSQSNNNKTNDNRPL
jgi:hypothetical protein